MRTAGISSGEFQTRFDRFSAAVGEECPVKSRQSAQLLGKSTLIFVVEKVRNVKGTLDLFAQHLFDARMVIPESIDADTCEQVQIPLVGGVDQINTTASLDQDIVASISTQNVSLFEILDV